MYRGYIKLWRKIKDHPLHPSNRKREYTGYEALLYLIHEAHFKDEPKKIILNGQNLEIRRGQLDVTNRQLASIWRWSLAKTNRFLNYLKMERSIEIKVNARFSVITVINYEIYNPMWNGEDKKNGTRMERKRNASGTLYKKGNKLNDPNSDEVRQKLLKWFDSMEDVKNPAGLVKFFFDRYPAEIIKKALANSTCTSRGAFSELCVHYSKKKF